MKRLQIVKLHKEDFSSLKSPIIHNQRKLNSYASKQKNKEFNLVCFRGKKTRQKNYLANNAQMNNCWLKYEGLSNQSHIINCLLYYHPAVESYFLNRILVKQTGLIINGIGKIYPHFQLYFSISFFKRRNPCNIFSYKGLSL